MLEKGECKIPGTREYKLFRRRFGVGFERYKIFCEATRTWNTTKDIDAAGRAAVPLELKVLGALRMVCKGCAFDAIAELSGIGKCTQGCGVLFRSVENLLPHSTLPHHVS